MSVLNSETIVETSTENDDIYEKINEIQEEIIALNSESDKITDEALSNAKSSDIAKYQEILVEAIMQIQEITKPEQESENKLMKLVNKISAKFGFIDKVKKTAEETFMNSMTLQQNIETIFDSLEGAIRATEQDLDTLVKLKESLSVSVEYGERLLQEVQNIIDGLGDSDEDEYNRTKLEALLRELKSINLVNSNTSNQIKAQLATTGGMAQNLREVRPILKNLLKSQTLVALQNARLNQATNVRDLVSGVVNEFIVMNNETTNNTILDAIEYSGKTVIEKDTVETLGRQHDEFVKELKHIVTDLNKAKLEYTKTVDKVTNQLKHGLSDLPALMNGKDVNTTKLEYKLKRSKNLNKVK